MEKISSPALRSHFGSLAPSFPLLLPMVFPSQILGTLVHPIGFGKFKSWLQVPPRHNLNKISSSPSNWAFPLSLEFQKKQTKLMTLPWSCFGNHWWPQQQKFPQKLCRPSIFAEDLVVESGPGKVGPAWKTERCFMTSIGTQTSAAICTHENWVLFSQHSTCELKIPTKDWQDILKVQQKTLKIQDISWRFCFRPRKKCKKNTSTFLVLVVNSYFKRRFQPSWAISKKNAKSNRKRTKCKRNTSVPPSLQPSSCLGFNWS